MDVTGSKELKVDGSGRFFLPKGMVDPVLGEDGQAQLPELWLIPSPMRCMMLVDGPEYRRMQKRVRISEYGDAQTQKVQQLFFGLTSRVKADKSGRITLTELQRRFAGITDELFLAGMGRRIDLWGMEQARERNLLDPTRLIEEPGVLDAFDSLLQGNGVGS